MQVQQNFIHNPQQQQGMPQMQQIPERQVVLFTSANSGSGKTFITINMDMDMATVHNGILHSRIK